jgi:hypothetical protein
MEEKATYTECEMKYIRYAGFEPSQAAEVCAKAEGRSSDEEREKPSEEDFWDE